jgi:hypothetical protein
MYLVRHSLRALLIALGPILFVQGILIAIEIGGTLARPPFSVMPSPDLMGIALACALAFNGGLLFAFHLCLRNRAVVDRFSYTVAGFAAGIFSYTIMWSNGWLIASPSPGAEVAGALLPGLAGMIAGFLYNQLAGLEPLGLRASAPKSGDAASLDADDVEPPRFEGPVQVRTSIAAAFTAATLPAFFMGLLAFATFLLGVDVMTPGRATGPELTIAFALPAQIFLMTLLMTILPAAIFAWLTHLAARSLGARSGLHYAAMGAALALAVSLAFGPFSPLTSIGYLIGPAMLTGAVMGALYRRLAGLEALPLPEPLIVDDERALVAADHHTRRGHAVIMN